MTGTLHNEEQECSDAGSIIDDDKVILGEVKRGLKPRHVQMIAIKGTIGTSVSLSAGAFVASAGPLVGLISYLIVGNTLESFHLFTSKIR